MDPRNINIEQYNYELPGERIARHPLAVRDSCRLLCRDGQGRISDRIFSELPGMLAPGSMLVYNNTRVINARLRFTKSTGALIEIFCLEPHTPADYAQSFASTAECVWNCLIGNSKRWKDGPLLMPLSIGGRSLTLKAEWRDAVPGAPSQKVAFSWDEPSVSFSDIIAAVGEIPIPPYLNRRSEECDSDDYQTVFSHIEGSVAAPTAGLHFTPGLLSRLDEAGVERREVTLHVGAGTFRPVKCDRIGDHEMHSEFIAVDRGFIGQLAAAAGQRPVVAVGTTSVRTLESLYHIGVRVLDGDWTGELPQWAPYGRTAPWPGVREALEALVAYMAERGDDTLMARTRIIIAPGYDYRVVDAMITNFHQPASTLLLLVSAFIGPEWRQVYQHALDSGYRFLSYGDACYFEKRQ